MHIVLYEPEIPQNTGNIARTCSATGSTLHLVRPLGFSTDDKHLKRAGLDYWHELDLHYHDSFAELAAAYPKGEFFMATTKGGVFYNHFSYPKDAFLVFGPETRGLPQQLLEDNKDSCIRIPMIEGARSLNLSNAVAIIAFEVLRQHSFSDMV